MEAAPHGNDCRASPRAGVAELVDALDLGSRNFSSSLSVHSLKPMFLKL
jgi:hypothetical protein